jgi:citrate synthase
MIFEFRDKIGLSQELNNLFEIALEIERLASEDEYFSTRGLYPNVDYYCGILLTAMHIPANMISVIIAISRCTGWICHWREMMGD